MSAILPSVILCGIYSWRGWVEIPEPRPLWRPCGARRRRPTFCGNICSVVFVPRTTHTPFKGGCMGRDGERVASPAGLSVPATFVPLVRGRAASLERGTDNVRYETGSRSDARCLPPHRGSNRAGHGAAAAPQGTPASAMHAFQERRRSKASASAPRWRPAFSTSSVRFALSHDRKLLRNCSVSVGYEKSTLLHWPSAAARRLPATAQDSTTDQIFGQCAFQVGQGAGANVTSPPASLPPPTGSAAGRPPSVPWHSLPATGFQ
jgi:hypothetical protein